jgi:hypothetical protein
MRKNGIIISAAFVLVCSSSIAQDLIVRALLDTNRALIGDQIKLRLLVEKPVNDWLVVFPSIADSLSGDIEILDARPIDTTAGENKQLLTQDLLITVFDTGFFEIPALPFRVSSGGFSDTLSTLPVGFEILSVKADSTIKDIKGIYKVPLSFRELTPYILGLTVAVLLGWLIVYYVKNRRVVFPGKTLAVQLEPPDVTALRELEQLKDEKPWTHNKVKYYYSRISEILRNYIEGRFNTLAMEQTTGEILQSLRHSAVDNAELNNLSDLLRLADLVKFARVIPDPEENAVQIGRAVDFVKNTAESGIAEKESSEAAIVENNRAS